MGTLLQFGLNTTIWQDLLEILIVVVVGILSHPMKTIKNVEIYIILTATSLIFLLIEHFTHIEFMQHLAAIPLEVLVGVCVVEKFLEKREKKEKRRLLMFIKSYLFRSALLNLFVTNFNALKFPSITMAKIRNSTLEELRQIRKDADTIEYKSLEAMEPVIMEYVKAEQVWHDFNKHAITHNFEEIFNDMVYMLHFIYGVKLFKNNNPDKLFVYEAGKKVLLMEKVKKVLGDGIKKFLDYMIELKEKEPNIFYDLISDYELSSQIMDIQSKGIGERSP